MMKRLTGANELLDGPLEPSQLAGNLRDLARVNLWLGGQKLSWQALHYLLRELPEDRPVRLLDVGTGAADIPLALLRRARENGRRLEIVATDVRPEIIGTARRRLDGAPGLELELATPDRLDHPSASFDIVHASLVAHHLEPPGAARLLKEMARVASLGVIVNDLFRRWHAWLGAWLLTRLATGNRYTRHDGPLSVRRAYQPAELARLAREAGLRPERLLRDPLGQRYALVLRPQAKPAT